MSRLMYRLLPGLALMIAVVGCRGSHGNAPVSGDKAREVLRTALESWKKGDKIDALQSQSPPIYVIDLEWQQGAKLKDYQIVGDGEEKDAHLFCNVRLTINDSSGKETTREVTYIISTAPNITVSRKLL